MSSPAELLERGWARVVAWYDAADPLCPCRTQIAPLVASWRAYQASPDPSAVDAQISGLKTAIKIRQRYATDDDEAEADEAELLRAVNSAQRTSSSSTPSPAKGDGVELAIGVGVLAALAAGVAVIGYVAGRRSRSPAPSSSPAPAPATCPCSPASFDPEAIARSLTGDQRAELRNVLNRALRSWAAEYRALI